MQVLKDKYEVELIWEGKKLCGINLEWDYNKREWKLNTSWCVKKLQQRFKHATPDKPQHAPADYSAPNHGQKEQYFREKYKLKKLSPEGIRQMQEIIGSCLH